MKRPNFTACACLLVWAVGGQGWTDDAPIDTAKRVAINRRDGGRLAYYHWPAAGPSLLLIPGSWNEYRQFDAIRCHLDQDVNLVIVELPGHGQSWPPSLDGTIESIAADVLSVANALGWKSWYAGGHSIGGMIAIELARQQPEEIVGAISIEGWAHHTVLNEAFSGRNYDTLTEAQDRKREQGRFNTLSRLDERQRAAFGSLWQRWDGRPIL